ncbi:MAG: hypothetical protein R3208_14505 [Ketobacteraceae bacterium]|nr:hypothetical protein [Ketobacteraceae bacterium]
MSYLHEWRPDLAVGPSKRLAAWFALVHTPMLALLPFTALMLPWKGLVACLVVLQWWHLHRRYAVQRDPGSVRRILWATDGWMLEDARGMHGPYRLSAGSRVNRDFMLLHFRRGGFLPWGLAGGSHWVPVLRDNVGDERFHLLQIFLRWQRASVLNPDESEMESEKH